MTQSRGGKKRLGIRRRLVGPVGAIAASATVALMSAALLYALIALWPPPSPVAGAGAPDQEGVEPTTNRLFGIELTLLPEQRVLLLIALAGALGAVIHAIRSLYWYIGNRILVASWLVMYACLPFVGAALATVFYIVLRGGLIPAGVGAEGINTFGFAAVAALVGLFTSEAAEKLKQVFATLLAPAEQGKDRAACPVVKHIEPNCGPPGSELLIFGDQLSDVTEVIFRKGLAEAEVQSSGELRTIVPASAESGPVGVRSGDTMVSGPHFRVIRDAEDEATRGPTT